MPKSLLLLSFVCCLAAPGFPQDDDFRATRMNVDFADHLRPWDGFGFNYVETAQTANYQQSPQEYGGFSLLDETEKQTIAELVFGEDGLRVGLVKMFLDPWHQQQPGGPYNHTQSTQYMRDFVQRGVQITNATGSTLQIITTLYGPPAYITQQKFIRGRTFDPAMKDALCAYYVSWVQYLKQHHFPIRYVSLHNEGEDWTRWPQDGSTGNLGSGHDYNMYWPAALVNTIIPALRKKLDQAGCPDVGVTNGETSNWFRFNNWGYAFALADDPLALRDVSLITSHGFYHGPIGTRWHGDHSSQGLDLLRKKKPLLKAWVTSTGWGAMDTYFVSEIQSSIYNAKVNGIIPWAGIQRPTQWLGGDPNPGAAFRVHDDGHYDILPGYYFYKQVTRAGQPGMAVARAAAMSSVTPIIAFSSNGTRHPDAFVVINNSDTWEKPVSVHLRGTQASHFDAYQTTLGLEGQAGKQYQYIGRFPLANGIIQYQLPVSSVTTFFAVLPE